MRSLNIRYIPELDQLRGVAALLVLYFHALAANSVAPLYMGLTPAGIPLTDNILKLVITNGFTGVALFFVLSGFLFTWGGLQSDHFDWRKFFINRILRIFPLYLLLIIVAFSLNRGGFSFIHFIQYVTGFGNMSPPAGDFDVVLWTISVELQFYMLFPFLLMLIKRKGVQYLLGLIALLISLRFFVRLDFISLADPVYWTMFGRLDQFLIGMIAAWYVHHKGWLGADVAARSMRQTVVSYLERASGLIVSLALLVGLLWLYTQFGSKWGGSYFHAVWPALEAVAWALVGLFYVGLVRLHRPKFMLVLQFVGMISYSLYMLHYPIIKALHKHAEWLPNIPDHRLLSGLLVVTVIVVPITLVISVLSYYVIEKPPLDLRQQYAAPLKQRLSRRTKA